MLKRLKALAVAAVLGSGLGVAVGLLMILPDPSLDLPIQYHLSVLSNFARIGGLAGLAFGLLLLGWFRVTRRIPGVAGSVVLGALALFMGTQTYLATSFTPICGTGSFSAEYLAWIAGVGGPCGALVGVAARSEDPGIRGASPTAVPLEPPSTAVDRGPPGAL